MNSKKLITLLVLTTLLIGLVPVIPVSGAVLDTEFIDVENDDKSAWDVDNVGSIGADIPKGEKGHDIYIFGPDDSVASGYEVMIYWDKITDWDGTQGHLNTTEVDSDGGFEIWFEVPEDEAGKHYIWITATDQETKVSFRFDVVPDCDLESSSGLVGDRVYVDFWGFDNNEDIGILFVSDLHWWNWNTDPVGPETLDTGDGDETDFDDTVSEGMIVPGTFVITLEDQYGNPAGALAIDDGTHNIIDNNGGDNYDIEDGSINYITGEWEIEFSTANPYVTLPDGWDMIVNYDVWEELEDDTYILASNGQTDAKGSWENRRITIPDDANEGTYYVYGIDGDNHTAYDDFTIGAVITVEPDEAEVGEVIEVDGEGFDPNQYFRVYLIKGSKEWECHVIDADEDANKTDNDGEFNVEVVVPKGKDVDDDYEIEVRCTDTVSEDFEITGLAEIEVDPDFGPQGSRITVTGENFARSSDAEITLELWDDMGYVVGIETEIEIESDGSFEEQVRVPTETDGEYDIVAYVTEDDDGGFNIVDEVTFRIGTMLVLLSEDSGVTGEKIILTGSGFSLNGEWNATMGDVTIFEDVEVSDEGILKEGGETPAFLVPQLEPGVYTITVYDVDEEISVEVDFEVEEGVYLELSTYTAPNKYNVTINGWNLPEVDGTENTVETLEWVIYNETDEWDMDVKQFGPTKGVAEAELNGTGFYNDAWWIVLEDDDLDLGVYWVNASIETTSDLEYLVQFEFTVSEVHSSIEPRKATFRIGDTVSFKVQHSFGGQAGEDIAAGKIKVYDPDGSLYWAAGI
jgi:hypothetical protein